MNHFFFKYKKSCSTKMHVISVKGQMKMKFNGKDSSRTIMYNINHLLFNIFYERVYDLWLTCFIYFVSLFNFHSYTNCSNFYFRGTVYVYRLHVYVSSTFLRCGSPSPYSSKYTNSVFWIQIKSNTNANSLQNFKLSMKGYAESETECEYNIQKIARVSGKC